MNDPVNQLCCVALRETVTGNLLHTVESIDTAKSVYDKVVKSCRPKGSSAMFALFRKLTNLKLSDCTSVNEYGNKFREIINELNMLPTHPNLSEMFYIYQYF